MPPKSTILGAAALSSTIRAGRLERERDPVSKERRREIEEEIAGREELAKAAPHWRRSAT